MRCLMANLILLSVLFAGSYSADAQQTIESDTTEICIYFKCDHSTFDPEYRNNGLSMDDFVRKIEGFRRDSTCILRSVTVTGSASPDGNTDLNKKLAAKRAANYPTPQPLEQDPGISDELRAALNALSPLDRALMLERVLDGMDYAALARIHGLPAPYLRTRYSRAKAKLAAILKEGEHDDL